MRTLVFSMALLATLGLGACSGGAGSGQGQGPAHGQSAANAQIPSEVTGTVSLTAPHALSDKAVLTIKLVDLTARNSPPLDTRVVDKISALPVPFSFQIKPEQINPKDLYAVQATIVDGERHFTMAVPAPVLTLGASAKADIKLKAIPTRGEKLMAAYNEVKAQLGAMDMSKGTSLHKSYSRGWQVFRDHEHNKVQYVIELTNHFEGNFVHTEYAYKDGKPWVIIRTESASEDAKPNEIDRAGWDEQGVLVLKQMVADGKTVTLGADKAADLKKQAEDMLATARETK